MLNNISKEDLFSSLRGLNISDYSIKDLEYLLDLFKIKSKQIECDIAKRKRENK